MRNQDNGINGIKSGKIWCKNSIPMMEILCCITEYSALLNMLMIMGEYVNLLCTFPDSVDRLGP